MFKDYCTSCEHEQEDYCNLGENLMPLAIKEWYCPYYYPLNDEDNT